MLQSRGMGSPKGPVEHLSRCNACDWTQMYNALLFVAAISGNNCLESFSSCVAAMIHVTCTVAFVHVREERVFVASTC